MATQTQTQPKQDQTVEKLRQAFADAPQYAKTALENTIEDLASTAAQPRSRMESAGRTGWRQGNVSELSVVAPFAPGGAARLRAVLEARNGNFDDTDRMGTVHDMRFVFLDNDKTLFFATAYDGDWDVYLDDFVAKIPDALDVFFSAWEGWPGIHSPKAKDWIAEHQVPAVAWYVAHPDLTVRDIHRVKRVAKAVDEFLDRIGN